MFLTFHENKGLNKFIYTSKETLNCQLKLINMRSSTCRFYHRTTLS